MGPPLPRGTELQDTSQRAPQLPALGPGPGTLTVGAQHALASGLSLKSSFVGKRHEPGDRRAQASCVPTGAKPRAWLRVPQCPGAP